MPALEQTCHFDVQPIDDILSMKKSLTTEAPFTSFLPQPSSVLLRSPEAKYFHTNTESTLYLQPSNESHQPAGPSSGTCGCPVYPSCRQGSPIGCVTACTSVMTTSTIGCNSTGTYQTSPLAQLQAWFASPSHQQNQETRPNNWPDMSSHIGSSTRAVACSSQATSINPIADLSATKIHPTSTTSRSSTALVSTDQPSSNPSQPSLSSTGRPRQRHNAGHIKKPLNAFMLFMKEMRSQVIAECTLKESAAINQILGRKWHALSREDQAKYYNMAKKEKELHQRLYPGWSARDNYASQIRRRNRTISNANKQAFSSQSEYSKSTLSPYGPPSSSVISKTPIYDCLLRQQSNFFQSSQYYRKAVTTSLDHAPVYSTVYASDQTSCFNFNDRMPDSGSPCSSQWYNDSSLNLVDWPGRFEDHHHLGSGFPDQVSSKTMDHFVGGTDDTMNDRNSVIDPGMQKKIGQMTTIDSVESTTKFPVWSPVQSKDPIPTTPPPIEQSSLQPCSCYHCCLTTPTDYGANSTYATLIHQPMPYFSRSYYDHESDSNEQPGTVTTPTLLPDLLPWPQSSSAPTIPGTGQEFPECGYCHDCQQVDCQHKNMLYHWFPMPSIMNQAVMTYRNNIATFKHHDQIDDGGSESDASGSEHDLYKARRLDYDNVDEGIIEAETHGRNEQNQMNTVNGLFTGQILLPSSLDQGHFGCHLR